MGELGEVLAILMGGDRCILPSCWNVMKTNYIPNLWMKYDVTAVRPHGQKNLHPNLHRHRARNPQERCLVC